VQCLEGLGAKLKPYVPYIVFSCLCLSSAYICQFRNHLNSAVSNLCSSMFTGILLPPLCSTQMYWYNKDFEKTDLHSDCYVSHK